jgi:hypothetical protein
MSCFIQDEDETMGSADIVGRSSVQYAYKLMNYLTVVRAQPQSPSHVLFLVVTIEPRENIIWTDILQSALGNKNKQSIWHMA